MIVDSRQRLPSRHRPDGSPGVPRMQTVANAVVGPRMGGSWWYRDIYHYCRTQVLPDVDAARRAVMRRKALHFRYEASTDRLLQRFHGNWTVCIHPQ